jgi:hypothetical protein
MSSGHDANGGVAQQEKQIDDDAQADSSTCYRPGLEMTTRGFKLGDSAVGSIERSSSRSATTATSSVATSSVGSRSATTATSSVGSRGVIAAARRHCRREVSGFLKLINKVNESFDLCNFVGKHALGSLGFVSRCSCCGLCG